MDKIKTTGIIEQTIYSDTGNVMYIVNVELNGNIVKAQSNNYSSKTKSLPTGKRFLQIIGKHQKEINWLTF